MYQSTRPSDNFLDSESDADQARLRNEVLPKSLVFLGKILRTHMMDLKNSNGRNGNENDKSNTNTVNVVIHCDQGKSRSGSIVIAWEMISKKLSYDEALAEVKKCRPLVQPNPAFVEVLRELERTREEFEEYLK